MLAWNLRAQPSALPDRSTGRGAILRQPGGGGVRARRVLKLDGWAQPVATTPTGRSSSSQVCWSVNVEAGPSGLPPVPPRTLRVHYVRKDRATQGWGLHTWGGAAHETPWSSPLSPTGQGPLGPYWDVPLAADKVSTVGVLVHKAEEKSADAQVDGAVSSEVWLVANQHKAFLTPPDLKDLPAGSLLTANAHWVTRNTIVWRMPSRDETPSGVLPRSFKLHSHRQGHMHVTVNGVQNAEVSIPLEVTGKNVTPDVMARFPHLYGCTTLTIPDEFLHLIPQLIQGQLALSVSHSDGEALDATGVQLQGLLDDTMYYDGPLGDYWSQERQQHTITVWAPTAQQVELLHWTQARGGKAEVHPMQRNEQGAWSIDRPASWQGSCYTFRLSVFCPWSQRLEVSHVTDPYSRGLTANGERTIMVDLDSPELQPPGWAQHNPPHVEHWTDISVYELHVRDFSACDGTVPPALRGKYRAFCPQHVTPASNGRESDSAPGLSAGLAHLAALRTAGLTHIHLLPTYDFGSVPERPDEQVAVSEPLLLHAADSERQQAAIAAVCDEDAYNWGYDPVHYGVPEGSYSQDPDSSGRIVEYREMVQSLHEMGLCLVLDVVYNHTFRSGPQDRYSVLDKLVPGYYHRRHEDGSLCHSTCCNNTATEHLMCERLMVEDVVHWAKDYKVDAFRFDVMGHHMMSTMDKIRAALDALTLEHDGVDGARIYLYGEAWDFGEVAFNQRGRNACQLNLAGSRLGGFNDRMRDGAMGGSPYQPPQTQGFVTGLLTDPNTCDGQASKEEQLQQLMIGTDWVRFALAGNLRDYEMQVADGRVVKGSQILYHANQPVAYGADPCENVSYNGCHDNETLFDQVMMKAADHVNADGRARMCGLALALVALSQGVAFFHAGDDLLRSKSLDRDSYNSGDWFNRIDWTGQTNNYGVGLPPASKNQPQWPLKRRLLARAAAMRPSPQLIRRSALFFQALLRVRYSSPLFRLPTAEAILHQLHFHNTGPNQVPGLIMMELESADRPEHGIHDPRFSRVVVLINASPRPHTTAYPPGCTRLRLHPALAALTGDEGVQQCRCHDSQRMLTVAARLVAVFVQLRD